MNSEREGRIITATRRFVGVWDQNGQIHQGKLGSKALDGCVGDTVRFRIEKDECFVYEILNRSNCLARSLGARIKNLATNLDRLFVVTAVGRLFNTIFIDRIMTAAFEQEIPFTLLINKCDLKDDLNAVHDLIDAYTRIGVDMMLLSAMDGGGLDQLRLRLDDPALSVVALSGVSGVGKSTILNTLIPEAEIRTREVSRRTGQGRQTTSTSEAHIYPRNTSRPLFVIDMPGVQNFGISHLAEATVRLAFPEFRSHMEACEYKDCAHLREQNCAVREGVSAGSIPHSRYASYLNMIEEIRANQPY